jgi:integrase/recombinase XerD
MNKNEYEQQIYLYFELKGTSESSKESYFRRMKAFIAFTEDRNISLETVNESDIQQYILYLKREKKLSAGTINNYISAIRFFYTYVLGKEWDKKKIPRMKQRTYFPVIPPRQDVMAILNATTNLKYKAIFSLMYGSGLRVSEAARLRICDICSKTMSIRVEDAKHYTNRYTILSETSLAVLRQYFRTTFAPGSYQSEDWLFPGQKPGEHINVKSIKNMLIKLRNRLHLDNRISAHTLRHCFATHCLENGAEVALIQQMLGHKNIKTTSIYLHMTSKSMMGIKSPLDTGDGD